MIYPTRQSHSATNSEKSEYAVLLHRLGALDEALQILSTVDPNLAPEALLYRTFCLFNRWEYEAALPVLESYLSIQTDLYLTFVARLNYNAALVSASRLIEAREDLNELIQICKVHKYHRLEGNCHELRSQIHIRQHQYAEARADLNAASQLLSSIDSFDSFLVKKWTVILDSLESGDPSTLNALREEAMTRGEWETARETDRYRLSISFDERTFNHLVFGTPFPQYRKNLFGEFNLIPSQETYDLNPASKSFLDVNTGWVHGEESCKVPFGRKIHQVVEILYRDFYRGLRIGGLFSELFPNERFDIESSPGRVHQLLHRTRQWCHSNSVPLNIVMHNGFYRPKLGSSFSARVPLHREPISLYQQHWKILEVSFRRGEPFTAKKARLKLGLPRTTFQRMINWALQEGLLQRMGEYNQVQYRRPNTPFTNSEEARFAG